MCFHLPTNARGWRSPYSPAKNSTPSQASAARTTTLVVSMGRGESWRQHKARPRKDERRAHARRRPFVPSHSGVPDAKTSEVVLGRQAHLARRAVEARVHAQRLVEVVAGG